MHPVLGIDLGATNMQFGVVDESNAITNRARGKSEAEVVARRGVRGSVFSVRQDQPSAITATNTSVPATHVSNKLAIAGKTTHSPTHSLEGRD